MANDEYKPGRWWNTAYAMDEITRGDVMRDNERYPGSSMSSVEFDRDGNPHRVTLHEGKRYSSPVQPHGKTW